MYVLRKSVFTRKYVVWQCDKCAETRINTGFFVIYGINRYYFFMENWKYTRELVFDKYVLSVTDMILSHEFFNFVWRIRVTKQLKSVKNSVKSMVSRCHTTVWQVWLIWSIYVLFYEILLFIITIQSIIYHKKLYIINNCQFWV